MSSDRAVGRDDPKQHLEKVAAAPDPRLCGAAVGTAIWAGEGAAASDGCSDRGSCPSSEGCRGQGGAGGTGGTGVSQLGGEAVDTSLPPPPASLGGCTEERRLSVVHRDGTGGSGHQLKHRKG